jgi:cytochrome c2
MAALLFLGSLSATTFAHAEGDPTKGEKVFRKCQSCHMVGEGAKNRAGPPLNDVIDSPAGTMEKYRYSKPLLAAAGEGLVWTEENLTEYLRSPRKFIPKGKMAFVGLKKDEEIADVIAFLRTFEQ